jgi:ATP-dependent DNA helicase RecQ
VTLDQVVDAIENAGCHITLPDLVQAAGVPAHSVERVVNELAELGFLALSGTGRNRVVEPVRGLPRPADLTEQLVMEDKRRQAVLASRLDAARTYAETTRCRRAELLAYFGETYPPPCGNCDNDQASKAAQPSRPTINGDTPVRHRLWGEGRMMSQDDHELLVYFTSVGYKHLTASTLVSGILEHC